MLSSYVEALRRRGAVAFSAAGFVARFPISMLGIGMVLLVADRSGSYALAGSVTATSLLAQAVAGPAQARAADRWGQRRVLLPLVAGHAASLAGFLAVVWAEAPRVWVFATAAVAGGTLPQVGSFVRARWAALLGGTERLQTAYALESVLDEMIFICGPVLVTGLATALHPLAGLGCALLLASVGGVVLACLHGTQPPVRGRTALGDREPVRSGRLVSVASAFLFLGAAFGAVEVATVAFADRRGTPTVAGLVLAAFAAGSLVAGVIAGAVTWRRAPAARFLVGLGFLALVLSGTAAASTPVALGAVLVMTGLAVAPTLITGSLIVQDATPASRLTEALAWTVTALAVGVALGSATAGALVEATGTDAAFLSAAGFAALAAVAAVPGAASTDRRTRAGTPSSGPATMPA